MKKLAIGGQAVMDGVMMQGDGKMSIAIRKPSGEISVKTETKTSLAKKLKVHKIPIIRGVVAFVDALMTGMKVISYSGIEAGTEEEPLTPKDIAIAVVLAIILTIGLFFVLPTLLTSFAQRYISDRVLLSATEGVIKISIFMLYIISISFISYIKILYQYHGAEHKTINCYEDGKPLTVENVRQYSTTHKRCGTSFLLLTLIISIVASSLISWDSILTRVLIRVAIFPLVAGVSYEVIQWAGRSNHFLVKLISGPGLLMQKLTTKEPSDEHIEVAIHSVLGILGELPEKPSEETADTEEVLPKEEGILSEEEA